jgi:heterogeneous nuclear ribonucleoprotein F/H
MFLIDEFEDLVAVRIHGMPFQATREEVYEFFADYKVVPDTLIFGLADDGRKSGLGSIIFETEDDAQKAADEKNKQYIGARFVNL